MKAVQEEVGYRIFYAIFFTTFWIIFILN